MSLFLYLPPPFPPSFLPPSLPPSTYPHTLLTLIPYDKWSACSSAFPLGLNPAQNEATPPSLPPSRPPWSLWVGLKEEEEEGGEEEEEEEVVEEREEQGERREWKRGLERVSLQRGAGEGRWP